MNMKPMGDRIVKRNKDKSHRDEFHPSLRLMGRACQPILKKHTTDGKPLAILLPPKGNRVAQGFSGFAKFLAWQCMQVARMPVQLMLLGVAPSSII